MKKLIELIIAYLYHKRVDKKIYNYFSLKGIFKIFDFDLPFEEVYNIAKYLEAQGEIDTIYILGDVFVKLSTLGTLKYEQKPDILIKKDKSEIADKEFEIILDKIVDEYSEETVEKSKKDILELIESIYNDILKSKENGKKYDYLKDIEILKLEIEKSSLDKEVIAGKINSLIECKAVTQKVKVLESLLNLNQIL